MKELCAKVVGEDPNEVMQWAGQLGVEYCWRGFGKDGVYEAIFNPRWQRREVRTETPLQSWRRFGNSPARNMAEGGLGRVLRDKLRAKLPEYMVPAAYVCLDRLPLTPNGKLDRKALPAPEQDAFAARGYEAPVGEMETKLAEVWAEVLKLEKVGRHNNFFELGGHSLLATRVISRIREVFHVELPLLSLFQNPTVAGLALQVDKAARTEAPPLRALPREQSPRLSFAQERLWFLSRYEAEASLYNIPVALRLRGPFNREALHASLQEIVARHEVLRTSFPETDGMARQNIASAADLSMPVIEMVESEMPKFLRQQARLPFDLATGPLIRACLLQLGNQDHVLLVVMHHIVSDGWSLGVMLREFNALYDSFSRGAASPLPPLPFSMPTIRSGNGNGCKARYSNGNSTTGESSWQAMKH